MPRLKSKDLPDGLKPYAFHGLDIDYKEGEENAQALCLSCDKNKLGIRADNGMARCFTCDYTGNAYTFIQLLWQQSYENTSLNDYRSLSHDRGYTSEKTLINWNLAKSILTDEWLACGYGATGALSTLYRYCRIEGKQRLLPTPTLGHQLFGHNLYSKSADTVFYFESLWDAIAYWDVISQCTMLNGKYVPTKSRNLSLVRSTNVLASPGCEVFFEKWIPLFTGKHVCLMSQNDHPRVNEKTGTKVAPASYTGMKKVYSLIKSEAASVKVMQWGPEGYTPDLASGFDVRDLFVKGLK